jgi:hypothetical protein
VGSRLLLAASCLLFGPIQQSQAQAPNPALHAVFPAGGQAGTSVTVSLEGFGLEASELVRTTVPRLTAKHLDGNRFRLDIAAGTPAGVYDLRSVGRNGMSTPRAFVVSNRAETLETEPNDTLPAPQKVERESVVNGRIEKPGDVDCFEFAAKAGQHVVVECWAERIDSRLRAVLEVYDSNGKRLHANKGHDGLDPLVEFRVPADGTYVAKLHDLSYLGSAVHFYRLEVDTRPRVEFVHPCVVQRGKATKVKLYGRNLATDEATITPPAADAFEPVPLPFRPAQIAIESFAYRHPGVERPVTIGITDAPVILAASEHHTPRRAQDVTIPGEVVGQLVEGNEQHWYAIRAKKGETLWLEGFGARLGAPIDLSLSVLDSSGTKELGTFAATLENIGGYRFPTSHPDPAGRWVAPADDRYLVLVRNLVGGLNRDERRVYRLSMRREEPDFRLAVVSRRTDQPAALNLPPGGCELLDVFAFRQRGMTGPIRISAESLPPGIQCPDAWIGPGQDRGIVALSASHNAPRFAGGLNLVGQAGTIKRPARGGTMLWPGLPMPSGRLTQEIPLAITASPADLVATATIESTIVDQESVLDIAIDIEKRSESTIGPIQLTAIGLPREAGKAVATIPAGKTKGWISVAFPATLPPGPYTIAVQAESTRTTAGSKNATPVTIVSNPITVQVRAARIVLELDPRTPTKIARGKTLQLAYTAERKHGFIGKIHTELTAPGGLVGLRARGVTFVGQTESGTIQVIASEDAPLGRHALLRLEAVGTVEDQPVYRASRFVELEIIE